MLTKEQWFAQGKDVEWRALLASQPIVYQAFEVILRTIMEMKEHVGDVEIQALQNAKRDGYFAAVKLLEVGLAAVPEIPDTTPKKPWTRNKLHNEHRSSSPTTT